MNILFFDTETTGLPINWKGSMRDLDNWPRVIQLAWVVADEHGEVIHQRKFLIKPNGWVIPNEKFWIDNGFSTEHSAEYGFELCEVLDMIIEDLRVCDCIVSHNMSFDYNVLGAEFIRAKRSVGKVMNKFCTKEFGTDVCQIPGNYGFKWPKLIELHNHLFNCDFENAHDALADVLACMKCFYEMVLRGVIILEPKSETAA